MAEYTASHWGVAEISRGADGAPHLRPFSRDPDPSGIGFDRLGQELERMRIRRPAVRRSFLKDGHRDAERMRGREPFIEIGWDEALDLVASEIDRIRRDYGNASIFGGSYGWASAGRFHHAQSQLHRFLNTIGGYVGHVGTYSLGAGHTILPHVVAPLDHLLTIHTSWDVLAENTELFVAFGGVPAKNAQISSGGAGRHRVSSGLRTMSEAGVRFVNISPVNDNIDPSGPVEWIPIRPNTDVALMIAVGHVLDRDGLADLAFLDRYCVGYPAFRAYLRGESDGIAKTPAWAEAITCVPASRIEALAREMAASRTLINCAWSLQRAHHGEQPFWMTVTLAAMLGQIGLPGGGFGLAYGPMNSMGSKHRNTSGPTLPQGKNVVGDFIPVARIADMLLNPGRRFTYGGQTLTYPDIRLVYWAGGNPFHHHQDLSRLAEAWRRPETVVVHEHYWNPAARFADIVLPVRTSLERTDISYSRLEGLLVWMSQVAAAPEDSMTDFDIFCGLSGRLARFDAFTEGRSASQWLEELYEQMRQHNVFDLPPYDVFRRSGIVDLSEHDRPVVMLDSFRRDPETFKLGTPSGRIEIFSQTIYGFGYADCPAHPCWMEPDEWLGAAAPGQLHLITDQPKRRLHSQLDAGSYSQAGKIGGREPVYIHPTDAAARGIADGDIVELFNKRGSCLSGAIVDDCVMPGVVRLATGAWYDPGWSEGPERAGNPNVLTPDRGASSLSQGCAAQTCLVSARRFDGPVPPISSYEPPRFLPRPADFPSSGS